MNVFIKMKATTMLTPVNHHALKKEASRSCYLERARISTQLVAAGLISTIVLGP